MPEPIETLKAALDAMHADCPECHGAGRIPAVERVRVEEPIVGAIESDLAKLPGLTRGSITRSTWVTRHTGQMILCWECRGAKRVLTEQGQEIVDTLIGLLAGHFAPADHGHTLS